MPDIFLSYNREDQAIARRFAEAFEAQGFSVWWDTALRSGEAYDEVTEEALGGAKAVVVLWSPRSVVSRWVRAEATQASRRGSLVPAMIEPCKRPIMFELTQTADLSQWTGNPADEAWVAFVADVRKFVETEPEIAEAPSTPTPSSPKYTDPLLAVLPFDNLSNDPEMQFFSDGVSEEIMQRLMRGAKLKVIGRASSFQFRGDRKAKAAAALNCTHVLDGSVRRSGARVRVAAHLIESSSQTTLWSDRFDGGLEDIFGVQDEISENIASALNRTFLSASTGAIDPAAYDLYLRALQAGLLPDELRVAIATLEDVTKRAPLFAQGWGRLAGARATLRFFILGQERQRIAAAAAEDAERALALDPQNPAAKLAQFTLLPPWGKFIEAEAIIGSLLRETLADGYMMQLATIYFLSVGRIRDAIAAAEQGIELDALNQFSCHLMAWSLWFEGRRAEAQAEFESTLERWPDNPYSAINLIMLGAEAGDWTSVDALMAPERLERYPLRHIEPFAREYIYLARSKPEESRRRALDVVRRHFERTGYADAMQLAIAAHFGATDEAYEIVAQAKLRPAGDANDTIGFDAHRPYFMFHAMWPELRRDPRFVGVCARMGLVDYWRTTQHWPDCVEELAPYYDFKAECEKVASGS